MLRLIMNWGAPSFATQMSPKMMIISMWIIALISHAGASLRRSLAVASEGSSSAVAVAEDAEAVIALARADFDAVVGASGVAFGISSVAIRGEASEPAHEGAMGSATGSGGEDGPGARGESGCGIKSSLRSGGATRDASVARRGGWHAFVAPCFSLFPRPAIGKKT
jgi:hypothetical protein